MRSPAQNAQLALLLEVTGTPKPGNVDRTHEYDDLRFEQFVAGAVSAMGGLRLAQNGGAVGRSFERSVVGMANQSGGNTQFGALLLVIPLVCTTAKDTTEELGPKRVTETVTSTTVEDAVDFYRAFEHVEVAVADPPDDLDALDVRRGAAAESAIRARERTLYDVMELSVPGDLVAREWTTGFEDSFRVADSLAEQSGPVADRAATTYLELLAERPDSFVETKHDQQTAIDVMERAQAARNGDLDPERLADELVTAGINPGATADIIAAGLYIALERGLSV
ncbi:triphosphoribosyl-dephospho-CoA synthase [Halocatena halophila]|uniref:triphosphoribosyl-dephospho-CoA synthase n=1 Tax=Halocatena halophila TaxID=2814576 RepID=UPI002ED4EF22